MIHILHTVDKAPRLLCTNINAENEIQMHNIVIHLHVSSSQSIKHEVHALFYSVHGGYGIHVDLLPCLQQVHTLSEPVRLQSYFSLRKSTHCLAWSDYRELPCLVQAHTVSDPVGL